MNQPKIFGHQSGVMKAVKTDLEAVLEATVAVVEKVKSDPPPKESLYPVDPGVYSITSENGHPEMVEQVILKDSKI